MGTSRAQNLMRLEIQWPQGDEFEPGQQLAIRGTLTFRHTGENSYQKEQWLDIAIKFHFEIDGEKYYSGT